MHSIADFLLWYSPNHPSPGFGLAVLFLLVLSIYGVFRLTWPARRVLLAASLCLLTGCVGGIDYTAQTSAGSERMHVVGLMGGSEAFETAGGTRWTGNRNKSFGQAAQAATTMIGSWAYFKGQQSANALAGLQNTNDAKVAGQKIAADAATAQAALNAKGEAVKTAAEHGAEFAPIHISAP
jgi:hypothetical protein